VIMGELMILVVVEGSQCIHKSQLELCIFNMQIVAWQFYLTKAVTTQLDEISTNKIVVVVFSCCTWALSFYMCRLSYFPGNILEGNTCEVTFSKVI
jgi:hypothetical protein